LARRRNYSRKSEFKLQKLQFHCSIFLFSQAGIDSVTSLGFKIAGGNDQPNAPNFTYIFVTGITENGLADRDKRLK